MKQVIIFILAICNTVIVNAQPTVFNNISLQSQQKKAYISFSTRNEVNVRYYSIEASNDNKEFNIIGRLPAATNSMHPVQHRYDLSGHDYSYYRIGQLNMNGTMSYSDAVTTIPPTKDMHKESESFPAALPELAEAKK